MRETAASTKLRVVYDASARETPNNPSLKDCLHPGPPLQNQLWEVLVRQRAFPVALAGNIKQAFLQIRIGTSERDALRFHWKRGTEEVQTLRFIRALFGLASSPFLLWGVLAAHLDKWEGGDLKTWKRSDGVCMSMTCLVEVRQWSKRVNGRKQPSPSSRCDI